MSAATDIRVDLATTEFLSQFKHVDAINDAENLRLAAYKARLRRGQPREEAWQDSMLDDAVPMTKAETIMRREEAMKMNAWPYLCPGWKYPSARLLPRQQPWIRVSQQLASAFYIDRIKPMGAGPRG